VVTVPFFKKFAFPKLDFKLGRRETSIVGIDIGASSVKVVELKEADGRAILKTYGELKTAGYFKQVDHERVMGGGFLRFLDTDIGKMVADVVREAGVESKQAVFSIPSASSFITLVDFPRLQEHEIAEAIPFEAKKYVPIPTTEVSLGWEVIDEGDSAVVKVLLVAVPHEVIEKYKRIADYAKLELRALEIEHFAMIRSLVPREKRSVLVFNIGDHATNVAIVREGVLRLTHTIDRGAAEITKVLARGLGVAEERAEHFKKTIGLSDRPEEQEVSDIIAPLMDSLLHEVSRIINVYNRSSRDRVDKIVLGGGGANLRGLLDYSVKLFGFEVVLGNPFARVVYPAFMQPVLKELGPSFAVAVGLSLREITSR
jgi:type IV pilus assembly protein PilM